MPASEKKPEPRAWSVFTPKGHEFDALVFPDEESAMLQACDFNEQYPEGESPHVADALYDLDSLGLAGIENPAAYIAQMHADIRTLAAEVEAWRAARPFIAFKGPTSVADKVNALQDATDTSNALTRAKEIQP